MFDDYPDDHEPTTHGVWLLSLVAAPTSTSPLGEVRRG